MLLLEKKRDQHAVVQFSFLLGHSPTHMYALMKTVYGNDVLSRATIFQWHAFFAARRALAATLQRSGQPKMSSMEIMVNKIEAIIMEDWSLMVGKLGAMLNSFCMSFFSSVKFNRRIQTGFMQFVVVWLLRFCSGWNSGCLCKIDQTIWCTRWFHAVVSFCFHFCRSLTFFGHPLYIPIFYKLHRYFQTFFPNFLKIFWKYTQYSLVINSGKC